jgi:SOS-response transcriptional repressor LexA
MQKLTVKQERIYITIEKLYQRNGCWPTAEEIGEALNIPYTSYENLIRALKLKGIIIYVRKGKRHEWQIKQHM